MSRLDNPCDILLLVTGILRQWKSMANNSFTLVDVEEKPRKTSSRKNKYQPIITMFCEKTSNLCRVEVPGKNANYVRLQLKKRIDALELGKEVKASVINGVVYLEKK
jgi:hypothetical protein